MLLMLFFLVFAGSRPVAVAMRKSRVLGNCLAASPILLDMVYGGIVDFLNFLTANCAGAIVFKEDLFELHREATRFLFSNAYHFLQCQAPEVESPGYSLQRAG